MDNSSGGSFTNNKDGRSCNLLETISQNADNWGLDEGNTPQLDYEYSCVEEFSTSILFNELSNKFGLDPYVLVEVTKSFANHIDAPKKKFRVYSEPIEHSTVVPKVFKQVNQVSSMKVAEYMEIPPYPEKVKENLLIAIANKSSKRSGAPYEQIDVKYQVSMIK